MVVEKHSEWVPGEVWEAERSEWQAAACYDAKRLQNEVAAAKVAPHFVVVRVGNLHAQLPWTNTKRVFSSCPKIF